MADSDDESAPGSAAAVSAALLEPLNPEQQALIEAVIGGLEGGQWPLFDYVASRLEPQNLDAAAILESLPTTGPPVQYGAVRWQREHGPIPPKDDSTVGLTILGLSLSSWQPALALVPAFVNLAASIGRARKMCPAAPQQPRRFVLESSSSLVAEHWTGITRMPALGLPFLHGLLMNEPLFRGSGGGSDSAWNIEIQPRAARLATAQTYQDYVRITVASVYQPPPPPHLATPSPFELVAALDYLDTTWRLAESIKDNGRKGHLFTFPSAQRAAQLAAPAQTEGEVESRLGGLAEILRTAARAVPPPKGRDSPLEGVRVDLVAERLGSEARISAAVATLHAVIDIRDGTQHSLAATKAARALNALGIGYPPPTWYEAWLSVQAKTIEALDVLREELAALAA